MPSDISAYPPFSYSVVWTVLCVCGVVLLVGWYGTVMWLTRHKPQRTVATLKPGAIAPIDVPAVRAKYLGLIGEVERAYHAGEMSSRIVHQKLSVLLRFFAQEAHGLRAFSLTLGDLRNTRYTQLTRAIEAYYTPEFHAVLEGDAKAALQTAREVVTTWS
jgi:hypothetical protein